MPILFQEKSKPDYSQLLKKEQSEKPFPAPEQAKALKSSEQITEMQRNIDQALEENRKSAKKRMDSAMAEMSGASVSPELQASKQKTEQELQKIQEAMKRLGIKTKEELKSQELDTSDKAEQAHKAIEQIFNVIQRLQNKEIGGQTIAELTILADRQNYLKQIEENLKALTSPDYIDEELKQAGPGELIQSIAEAGYHIVDQQDKEDIKEYLEQLEHIKEDAAEKMGQSNREIDRIQALKKKSREKAESQIPELEQRAQQYQAIVRQIEPNLEYQESLLKKRDKIDELIKIGAITKEEINELKQSFGQTAEKLEQMIPKEIREQAEKDADEIQKQIEAMIAQSGGSGYRAALEAGVNIIRKLLKYHPEQSSKIKKIFVKTAEVGLAAVAVFLVSHITESGLFGGGEAEAMVSADTSKEYTPEKVQELMQDLDYLKAEFGSNLPQYIQDFEQISDEKDFRAKALKFDKEIYQESLKYKNKPIEFENMSEFAPGILTEETIQKIIKDTLPKNFLNAGNVEKISCATVAEVEQKTEGPATNIAGRFYETDIKRMSHLPGRLYLIRKEKKNTLTQDITPINYVSVQNHILFHEIVHSMFGERGMNSISQQIRWRSMFSKRLKADDQYRNFMLNRITDRIEKDTEYPPEVISNFLNDPNDLSIPPQDKEIAKEIIKEIAPDFDWQKAFELRQELVEKPILTSILNFPREYWSPDACMSVENLTVSILGRSLNSLSLESKSTKASKTKTAENTFWTEYDSVIGKINQIAESHQEFQPTKENIIQTLAQEIKENKQLDKFYKLLQKAQTEKNNYASKTNF